METIADMTFSHIVPAPAANKQTMKKKADIIRAYVMRCSIIAYRLLFDLMRIPPDCINNLQHKFDKKAIRSGVMCNFIGKACTNINLML